MQYPRLQKLTIAVIHPCEIVKLGIGALLEQNGARKVLLFNGWKSFAQLNDFTEIDLALVHYSQCNRENGQKELIEKGAFPVALLASSDSFHKDSFNDVMNRMMEGYSGFLNMDEPAETFFSEIINTADGGIVISRKFASNIAHRNKPIESDLDEVLSQRELAILDLIATGSTNSEIGQELHISPHTVKGHLTNILTKLNLKNRQQAVAYIMKRRLKEA
jgi:DNA-binding NarL/FixJ family response regulator